jgi:hypothetical protein
VRILKIDGSDFWLPKETFVMQKVEDLVFKISTLWANNDVLKVRPSFFVAALRCLRVVR